MNAAFQLTTRLSVMAALSFFTIGCGNKDVTPVTWPFIVDSKYTKAVACSINGKVITDDGRHEISLVGSVPLRVDCESVDRFQESAMRSTGNTVHIDATKMDAGLFTVWRLYAVISGQVGGDKKSILSEVSSLTGNVSNDRRTLVFDGKLQLPKTPGLYDFRLILIKQDASSKSDASQSKLTLDNGVFRATIRITDTPK